MTASVPSISIGAENPLAFAPQDTLGTAETTPTFSVDQTENTIRYDTGAHEIASAVGSRAANAEGAQGRTMTTGGFGTTLRSVNVRDLLKAYFGGVDSTTTMGSLILTPTQPSFMTVFDPLSHEIQVYQDVLLNECRLQSQRQVEWTANWTVLGGLRTVGADSIELPAVDTDGRTLAWADTSISGIGDTTPCQVSETTISLSNNVQQWFGAGGHSACNASGGILSAQIQFELLYSDANAAQIEQDYADGTTLGDVTVTITDGSSDTHVIVLPKLYITASEPQRPLGELVRLRVTASSLDAGNMSWTLPAAA